MSKQFKYSTRIVLAVLAASFAQTAAAKTPPPPPPEESGPSKAQLEEEIQELRQELQMTQSYQAQQSSDVQALKAVKPSSGWWDDTKISGRMYYDLTSVTNKVNGTKTGNANGVGFDIKRFYIGVDHNFNKTFSANITTDFQYDSTIKATELYIKKAYLQAKVSDALVFRFGSTDLPWVPFAEDAYGYRYLENTLIDRTKFGTSADWGVHASGKFGEGGMFQYAVAVINGAGYKAPPGAGNQTHFNSVDVEGRVSAKVSDFTFALGGYTGKLGKDVGAGVPGLNTATRWDALAAYTTKTTHLGVEYFHADDWPVTSKNTAEGYSIFGSYYFQPEWGVFGRYDDVEPTKDTSGIKDKYYTVGVSWSPTKIVDFSLAYKHEKAENGSFGTSNGTIGGATDGVYDEVGIWSQFRW